MSQRRQPAKDWDPAAYAGFGGLRLRPALDLLAQVPELPAGDVVDLGCGNGAVAGALAARWPHRRLTGVDNSPAMLAEAEKAGHYSEVARADAQTWAPAGAPALIFSNALCHWLDDHAGLFSRLAALLAPGGTLAVQMPRQFAAPSHALLRELAQQMFCDRFDFSGWQAPVACPEDYARLLAPLGAANVWESEYIQRLAPVAQGHPVHDFTRSTAMRPFVQKLDVAEAARFEAAYIAALAGPYPAEADGSVLFGFRRLFFVLTKPAP